MPKTFDAPFPQTPKISTAVVTAACVIGTADAPTNTVLLVTAGTEGAIVTNLSAMPFNTVPLSSLLLFLSNDGGVTKRLIDSEVMQAFGLTTNAVIPETQFSRYSEQSPLRVGANDRLYVGSQVATNAVFKAEFTDY